MSNKFNYAESAAKLDRYAASNDIKEAKATELARTVGVSFRAARQWLTAKKRFPVKLKNPYAYSFDAIESYAERNSIDGMSVEAIAQATGVSHKAAQIWHQRRRQAAERQRVEGRQRLFWTKGSRLFSVNRIPNEVGQ